MQEMILNPYATDLGLRVVQADEHRQGTMRQLALTFRVSRSCVRRRLKHWRDTGRVAPSPMAGALRSKWLPVGSRWCRPWCTWRQTPPGVHAAGGSRRPLSGAAVLPRGVASWRRCSGRAQKTLHATAQARAAVQRQRAAFREARPAVAPTALVVVDASGRHHAMAREDGRAPWGPRAPGAKPVPRGPPVTLVGALGVVGVVAAMLVAGVGDGAALLAVVQEVLGPQRRPGPGGGRDHLPAHQVVGVRAAIEAGGARLLSLPPDAPDVSPMEDCWSKIKRSLRTTAARTRTPLWPASTEALAAITSQDAQGGLAPAGYRAQPN
jgi:hypothetical protein